MELIARHKLKKVEKHFLILENYVKAIYIYTYTEKGTVSYAQRERKKNSDWELQQSAQSSNSLANNGVLLNNPFFHPLNI